MAAPISRNLIVYIFRKYEFSRRLTVLGSIKSPQHNYTRPLYVDQSYKFRDDEGTFRKKQYSIYSGLLVGCAIAASVEALRRKYYTCRSVFPVVEAATLVHDDKSEIPGPSPPSSKLSHNNFIADMVEKASPSVVYIEIKGRHPFSGRNATLSNGSGFVVRQDGLILTNAHVVANKHNVTVTLNDGRKFDGIVHAVDPLTDLATVRIQAINLPALSLANSNKVRPGEWVVAMGSPLSLSNTVTAGIVSTVHRGSKELGLHNKDMEYIQTDAVINFGNSGGPLVNLEGEAIGINSMKVTTGISFAIPANYARDFLEKADTLEKSQKSQSGGWFNKPAQPQKRRYIGVTMLTLTPSIAAELRNRMEFPDIDSGVLVHKVVVGSPAYSGGIQPGDVIVEINNKPIQTASDVYNALQNSAVLKIKIMHSDHIKTLHITAEEVE